VLQIVTHLFANGRTGRQVAELLLARLDRLHAEPLGFHQPHDLVQAGRISHKDSEKRLKRLEVSQRISEDIGLWRSGAFFFI
jgi:hypothetical protein